MQCATRSICGLISQPAAIGWASASPARQTATWSSRSATANSEQQIAWHAGQWMTSHPLSVDIRRGNVQDYPFDRYTATLTMAAYASADVANGMTVPLRITVWKRLPAWDITISATQPPSAPATITLTFGVRRADLHIIFATTIYCAMAVMAIIALSVGSLLYLGVRRMDTTMAAVLAAMVFTLPGCAASCLETATRRPWRQPRFLLGRDQCCDRIGSDRRDMGHRTRRQVKQLRPILCSVST